MIYLNTSAILRLGMDWADLIAVIEIATQSLAHGKFSQPVKPYLKFNDPKNRIIAMPAFVGGIDEACGLKWIASFPSNKLKSIPRAHSITILNSVETGEPLLIINSPLISAIRTAAVSGFFLKQIFKTRSRIRKINFGIIGYGPIGRQHNRMLRSLFPDLISQIYAFELDQNIIEETTKSEFSESPTFCNSWQELYDISDVIITCTVSNERYINLPPKAGTIHLNVSLRDYSVEFIDFVDILFVDDWIEVCRENTDVHLMFEHGKISKNDAYPITQLLKKTTLSKINESDVVMFNPMGMAVFDIAIANYYYKRELSACHGIIMPN